MANEVVPSPFFHVEPEPSTLFSSLEFDGGSALPLERLISDEKNSGDLFERQKRFMLLELQNLTDRYNDAFRRLQLKLSDLNALNDENLLLVSENLELLMLVREEEKSSTVPFSTISPSSSSSTVAGFSAEQLRSANPQANRGKKPISGVDEADTGEAKPIAARSALPKSISIRSNGFLAGWYPTTPYASSSRAIRLRLPATAALQEGEGEEEVEVEAYSQGTTKTELCNNWGQMQCCPYEERCRFAHGIEELRPVIRHPRYKTQPCRMLRNAGGCPYGHRCHFRHANLPESHPY